MDNTLGKTPSKPKFVPSKYQTAVFDWASANMGKGKHLIVEAVAGSGKTTTGVQLFSRLPSGLDVAFVAFNSHIAAELKSRLPQGSNARTYHSLGLATLKRTFPDMIVNQDKVRDYVKGRVGNNGWMIPSITKLVSLCKGRPQADYSIQDLERLAFMYDVELYDEKSDWAKGEIFDHTLMALGNSLRNTHQCDFDDMIWLPNVLDHVAFFQLDFMLVDEVQDTNQSQLFLAKNSIKDTGMIIGVGDRKQSIYFFRGADETAMDRLKEELNAEELPLSISYRCPVSVGQLVNQTFPSIKFEVTENAEQGLVQDIPDYDIAKKIVPNDMLLCRVTAPLIPLCFTLIKSGVKATVRGRDIGKGLAVLIKKSKATELPDMFEWLGNWKSKEIEKAMKLGADDKITLIQDKVDTIYALSDGAKDVGDLLRVCDEMFSDTKEQVVLSTVHRAKGLEADRVFILRPDLIPHPMARSEEQIKQEDNLKYVAYTRAKKELIFVR